MHSVVVETVPKNSDQKSKSIQMFVCFLNVSSQSCCGCFMWAYLDSLGVASVELSYQAVQENHGNNYNNKNTWHPAESAAAHNCSSFLLTRK